MKDSSSLIIVYHILGPRDYHQVLAVLGHGTRLSKAPETFRTRKAKAKSRALRLHSRCIHIFLI